MVRLVHGLLVGVVLLRLHRPLGQALLEVPAVPAGAALAARGMALVLAAGAVLLARRSFDGRPHTAWITGVAVGLSLEGLAGGVGREADGGTLALAVLGLALLIVRELRGPAQGEGGERGEDGGQGASPVALGVQGAGLALGLEGLARLVRRLGAGRVADDGAFAAVFVAVAAVGALALGGALGRRRLGARAASCALSVAGAGLVLGLMTMRSLATPPGLRAHLARFGLDASEYGTLGVDVVLGASVFAVPALFAGLAVCAARRRVELAALLVGGAFGLQLVPILLATPPDAPLGELPHSAALLPAGLVLVGAGALLGLPRSAAELRRPAGVAQLLLALALFGPAAASPVARVPVLPAWTRFPHPRSATFETPEGQFLIRPGAGLDVVTLDHRPLTPGAAGARADGERLRLALDLLEEDARERGPRVLLVGQLTPGRALVLAEAGVVQLDRTGAWWRVMQRLEEHLFTSTPEWLPEALGIAGTILAPHAATRAARTGEYDLVVVPAVPGRLPLVPRGAPAEGTLAVVWLDGASDVDRRSLEGPVLVTSDGLEELALGAVSGTEPPDVGSRPGEPAFLAPGRPALRPRTFAWMAKRVDRRGPRAVLRLAERLAAANAEEDWEPATRAFARHARVQRESSPWDTLAQSTEVDDEALAALVEAAAVAAPRPDRWTSELARGLAQVLAGKRDVERIHRYVEPVAELWPGWREGTLALALAEIESLEPAAAVARLSPLFDDRGDDLEVGELLARAHREAGDADGELAVLGGLADRATLPRPLRRRYCLALAARGELGEARRIGADLLAESPEDEELAEALGSGH